MKKFLIILIILMFCNVITFAEIKTFTKEATEVVPANQSQDQVIAYLTQKLTRQATEEAGVFINTEFSVKNKEITKDEFTSVAGSISKVVVENKETFTKDNQQYVKVKVKIDVDTDTIQPYLDKILQDNQYKKEAEELRKEKLELEEKLKTATKKQYEQELSAQVQQQVELQKQRAIELNKMAIQAKEEYAKAEQSQKQQEIKRQEELNALKKQIEQENLKTQQKIAQEKDNIKKAELENQAKIRDLENKAKENIINWQQATNRVTIEQAIEEARKVKQEVDELFDKFEKLSKTNKEDLIKSYDTQINILKTTGFQEKEPIKDAWETQQEYDTRLQKYNNNKRQFEENADKKIKELEETKDDNLLKEELGTLQSTINTTKPFIGKLKYFQTENFYSKNGKKAKLVSVGEINPEEQYFVLNVNYESKDYSLKYDFSNVGREKAKLMCQTQNQFVIEPLFSVNNNTITEQQNIKTLLGFTLPGMLCIDKVEVLDITDLKDNSVKVISCKYLENTKWLQINFIYADKEYTLNFDAQNITKKEIKKLCKEIEKIKISPYFSQKNKTLKNNELKKLITAFNVKHLGTQIEKNINISKNINSFDEIQKFTNLENNIKDKNEKLKIINQLNTKLINLLKNLPKNSPFIEKSNKVLALSTYKKIEKFNLFNNYIDTLGNLIIDIYCGDFNIVGLTLNGSVVTIQDNSNDNSIRLIAYGDGYSYYGDDYESFSNKTYNFNNRIKTKSSGKYHTVYLKGGEVFAEGNNDAGQCDVQNWRDIVAVSAGSYCTVGLKSDGTILATGLFFTSYIVPGEATDYEFRKNNNYCYVLSKGPNLPDFENKSKQHYHTNNVNIIKEKKKTYNCPYCGYYYSNGISEDDTFCIRCKKRFN